MSGIPDAVIRDLVRMGFICGRPYIIMIRIRGWTRLKREGGGAEVCQREGVERRCRGDTITASENSSSPPKRRQNPLGCRLLEIDGFFPN